VRTVSRPRLLGARQRLRSTAPGSRSRARHPDGTQARPDVDERDKQGVCKSTHSILTVTCTPNRRRALSGGVGRASRGEGLELVLMRGFSREPPGAERALYASHPAVSSARGGVGVYHGDRIEEALCVPVGPTRLPYPRPPSPALGQTRIAKSPAVTGLSPHDSGKWAPVSSKQ
jgi:hypothetical protein